MAKSGSHLRPWLQYEIAGSECRSVGGCDVWSKLLDWDLESVWVLNGFQYRSSCWLPTRAQFSGS